MASSNDLVTSTGKANGNHEYLPPAVESAVAYRLVPDLRDGEKIVIGIGLEVTALWTALEIPPDMTIDTCIYTALGFTAPEQ